MASDAENLRGGLPATRSTPALQAQVVAPSDAADLPTPAKALRVFVPANLASATVRVTYLGAPADTPIDLAFPSGLTIEPSSVRKIWATGTTAGIAIIAYGL